MALPNPALTFEQSSLETAASSSTADVLTAIEAAFAALSTNQWTTARAKGEDASNPAIRITAPSGSPISNFNAILGAPASASSGFRRASYRDYTQTAAVDTVGPGNFYLAVGPDGYDNATAPTNWYSGVNAFGTSGRESGFWCATANSGGISAITKVWVVASAETCAICFRYGTDNACGFIYFGAIVEGVNAANVESDDRLYGMCVSGNQITPMPSTWSYSAVLGVNVTLGHVAANAQAHAGVFDPTVPAGSVSFPATIAPRGSGIGTGQRIFNTLTFDGGLAVVPLQSWRGRFIGGTTQAPYYAGYCGRLRGIYWTQQGPARSILLDTGATPKGYRMGGSLISSIYDACVFYNES